MKHIDNRRALKTETRPSRRGRRYAEHAGLDVTVHQASRKLSDTLEQYEARKPDGPTAHYGRFGSPPYPALETVICELGAGWRKTP